MWTKYYVTMDNKERFYSEGEINYLTLQIKNPQNKQEHRYTPKRDSLIR